MNLKRQLSLIALGLLISQTLFSQQKIVDNSPSSTAPSQLLVSSDDTKMTFLQDVTFNFLDINSQVRTSVTAEQFTEIERATDVIFGRGKIESTDVDELIYATTENVELLDYYTIANNFPRVWTKAGNGAYFGSGKFAPQTAGRDFIRVSPDLTTVTNPFNNVTSGNDLVNKNLYQVHIVGFGGDKVLVKAYRTSADEEYFVWDDTNETVVQITDIDNSDTDAVNATEWPLAKSYENKIVFFYNDALYTTDGTQLGTTLITTVTNMDLDGIGGADTYFMYGNEVGGDSEPYIYVEGGSGPEKVDLNASGSSNPTDFVENGSYIFFIADTGDGYEPHISDGTVAGTKLLMDINPNGASMTASGKYDITNVIAAGSGFVFGATDGTDAKLYYTDGDNVVALDNYDSYNGQNVGQANTLAATDDFVYFTDTQKDIFKVATPTNIYDGSTWSEGTPVAGQSLYFNSDYTVSSDLTIHSAHLPEGITLTISSSATLTIDDFLYSNGTILEDGGTLDWEEPVSFVELIPVIDKVTAFLDTAQTGFEIGQHPAAMIDELTIRLDDAIVVRNTSTSSSEVNQTTDELELYLVEVLWNRVWPTQNYEGNLKVIFGDLKQAQINDLLPTERAADYLLLGMRELQVDGVRIAIFGDDTEGNSRNPNKAIYDYFYNEAIARGFLVFANPAEFGGARRIGNNSTTGDLGPSVNGVTEASDRVIAKVKEFALEYACDYVSPFNEDGLNGQSWNVSQVNGIYSSLVGEVNGATLIGTDNHNLASGINMLNSTDVMDYISVATNHNLLFQHDRWPEYIAIAQSRGLPVWESEATDNPKDIDEDGIVEESRLLVAVQAGVDGLVYYNSWNTVDLTNGSVNSSGYSAKSKYIASYTNVTGISILGDTEVAINSTLTLSADIAPIEATDQRLYWSSSDESIAVVDQEGIVTGVSEGAVVISANAIDGSGVSNTFNVNVTPIFVTDISLSGLSVMSTSTTQTLTAEILPNDAAIQDLDWSSDNVAVATVDVTTGLVTAIGPGSAVITAAATDRPDNASGTFPIEVSNSVVLATSVSINGNNSIVNGQSQTLTADVLPANATSSFVVWSSSDESIATVDQLGNLEALNVGVVTITAATSDGSSTLGTMEISVTPILVSSITVTGNTAMIAEGTQTLSAAVLPENAADLSYTWSSANSDIAVVQETTGFVTAISTGSVDIIATANDGSGVTGTITIEVAPILVTSISINGSTNMTDGETQTLSTVINPINATDLSINWSSSNSSIATVDSNGLVTAVGAGNVSITATANDGSGSFAFISISISPVLITGISLDGNTEMLTGDSQTLIATINPDTATAQNLTWVSSNTELATVDANGVVNALAAGSVTITATSPDGTDISDSIDIDITTVLSTSEALSDLLIYPNPTQQYLSISLPEQVKKASFSITSLLGNTVLNGELDVNNSLDVSTFQRGVYFITIKVGDINTTKKLILE